MRDQGIKPRLSAAEAALHSEKRYPLCERLVVRASGLSAFRLCEGLQGQRLEGRQRRSCLYGIEDFDRAGSLAIRSNMMVNQLYSVAEVKLLLMQLIG